MLLMILTSLDFDVRSAAVVAGIALALWGMLILLPLHRPRAIAGARKPDVSSPAVVLRSQPLTSDEQWEKVSSVIVAASDAASTIRNLQKSAAGHLDSANYALQEMMFELETVMQLSNPKVASLRRREPVRIRIEQPEALAA